MVTTLQQGPFFNSLCKKPTANLYELRHRVANYMQLEELREHRSQARAEASGEKRKDKEKEHSNRPAID